MIEIFSRLFFGAVSARVEAQKAEILQWLHVFGADSPQTAVQQSRLPRDLAASAMRSLRSRRIVLQTDDGRLYLDRTRIRHAAGVSGKFALIAMSVTVIVVVLLVWIPWGA